MTKTKNQYGTFRDWTPDEDVRLFSLSYMDAADIASALKRTLHGVYTRATHLGLRIGYLSNAAPPMDYVRFLARREIERQSEPDLNGGCWLWTGLVGSNGYGRLSVRKNTMSAHRWSYTAFRGEIPDGALVCHSCDVRVCVNPDHLWLGTHKDNTRDMLKKGRARDRRGSKNKAAKLSDAAIIDIRATYKRPVDAARLAEKHGCSIQTVRDIKARRTWTHI